MNIFGDIKKKHAVAIDPVSMLVNLGILFSLFLLFQVRNIVVLVFLAFILMTALHPFVNKLHRSLKIPRALSISIAYLTFVATLFLLVAVVVPPLASELVQLVRTLDIPYFQEEIRKLSTDITQISGLLDSVGTSAGVIFDLISQTFGALFTVLTLLVISIYMMIDRPDLHKKIIWFTQKKKHLDMAENYLNDLEHQLGGWVRGQFVLMLIIGSVTYVVLLLMGIPYALPLAIMAGLLEIVPNLGPVIASIPAIVLAYFTGGPVLAGVTTLFYVLIQQLENNLIVPRIMKQSADVNPLVAMIIILVGLQLGGVIGALISVPSYIVLRATYATFRRYFN